MKEKILHYTAIKMIHCIIFIAVYIVVEGFYQGWAVCLKNLKYFWYILPLSLAYGLIRTWIDKWEEKE